MDIDASLPFSAAFDFTSEAIARRFQNPFWRISELITGARLRASIAQVKHFSRKIVLSALAKRNSATQLKEDPVKAGPTRQNLIDNLLDQIADHQIVADAAMNYLSAGSIYHPERLKLKS